MESIINKIIFGKGIDKFRLFTTSYLAFMCALICNKIVNEWDYFYDPQIEIKMNTLFEFLISPIGICSVILFGLLCLVTFTWGIVLMYVIGRIFEYVPAIMRGVIWFLIYAITFRFKKIKYIYKDASDGMDFLVAIGIIKKTGTDLYEGKNYKYFKPIVQEIIDPHNEEIFTRPYKIFTLFLSSTIVFYLYDLQLFFPHWIYTILELGSIYFGLNFIALQWLLRKQEFLETIILTAKT